MFCCATYNLVVGIVAFGLDVVACYFQLSLAYTGLGNNPLKILNLHTRTSTWSPFLKAPLFKSCSTLIIDCVFSLKGNEQAILLSIVCFLSLGILAKHMLKENWNKDLIICAWVNWTKLTPFKPIVRRL
jgi:hypothetical protein